MLTAGLATRHKDRFIERQPGDNSATTRLEWDGLGVIIRSFWFGLTYLRGRAVSFYGPRTEWPRLCLVCVPVS